MPFCGMFFFFLRLYFEKVFSRWASDNGQQVPSSARVKEVTGLIRGELAPSGTQNAD